MGQGFLRKDGKRDEARPGRFMTPTANITSICSATSSSRGGPKQRGERAEGLRRVHQDRAGGARQRTGPCHEDECGPRGEAPEALGGRGRARRVREHDATQGHPEGCSAALRDHRGLRDRRGRAQAGGRLGLHQERVLNPGAQRSPPYN